MKPAFAFALFFSLLSIASAGESPPYRAEIDSLLAFVRRQEDATFLRNGATHDARQAEAHLRLKWSRQAGKIRSAEDFIERCGTRSFLTGRPYRVRFKDGSIREAGEVLREELKRLRGENPAGKEGAFRSHHPSPVSLSGFIFQVSDLEFHSSFRIPSA